jgi:hypothetical protein
MFTKSFIDKHCGIKGLLTSVKACRTRRSAAVDRNEFLFDIYKYIAVFRQASFKSLQAGFNLNYINVSQSLSNLWSPR